MLFAFLSASSFARFSASLIINADSCASSSFIRCKIICLAWSVVYPEMRSSSVCCSSNIASTLLAFLQFVVVVLLMIVLFPLTGAHAYPASHLFYLDFLLFALDDFLVIEFQNAVHAILLPSVVAIYGFRPLLQEAPPF